MVDESRYYWCVVYPSNHYQLFNAILEGAKVNCQPGIPQGRRVNVPLLLSLSDDGANAKRRLIDQLGKSAVISSLL